jgi:hypothetical protein
MANCLLQSISGTPCHTEFFTAILKKNTAASREHANLFEEFDLLLRLRDLGLVLQLVLELG